jgi:hypothetical protein
MTDRYQVHPVDPDDVVLRPMIVDTWEHVVFSTGWKLNDWDRAQKFADQLNDIENGAER